ncbi:hypothetical protein QBC45DRAFT_427672 [Copromyces sp. CBS 386.78]|nr:hypothetical protein QBC45DRAFT_427672 [Copromyces sp. CBS 386.78]
MLHIHTFFPLLPFLLSLPLFWVFFLIFHFSIVFFYGGFLPSFSSFRLFRSSWAFVARSSFPLFFLLSFFFFRLFFQLLSLVLHCFFFFPLFLVMLLYVVSSICSLLCFFYTYKNPSIKMSNHSSEHDEGRPMGHGRCLCYMAFVVADK